MVQPYSTQSPGTAPSTGISFDKSLLPGIYSVLRDRDTLLQLTVNVDPIESIAGRTPLEDLFGMAQKYGVERSAVSIVKNPELLGAVVLQSRFGVELWNYFLIAAIVAALTEMIVARESKQEGA